MPINAVYETLEDVPEQYRDLFSERGGKWELTGVTGIKTEADVERVQEALKKERVERGEIEKQLKAYGGVDADGLQDRLDELERLRITGGNVDNGKIDELVAKRVELEKTKHARELEKRQKEYEAVTGELDTLKGQIKRNKILTALRDAASAANVVSSAFADVEQRASLFDVLDDGEVVTTETNGVTPGLTAEQWLAEQVQASPHWLAPSNGAGAKGGARGPNVNSSGESSILDLVKDARTS
jgi:hypothetical protein